MGKATPSPTASSSCPRVMLVIARLNIGGPAVHVALLTARLRALGFEPRLVAGVVDPSEGDMTYYARACGVEPIILASLGRNVRPWSDAAVLIALVSLFRRERPHIVHTHTAKAGAIGRLAARLAGVPVVVHTFHGHVLTGYFSRPASRLIAWTERMLARMTDRIITLGESLAVDLVELGVAPREKICVVPLGLDLTKLAPGRPRGAIRTRIQAAPDDILVGIVARLVPIKGHEVLLQAARTVVERRPDTRFVLVGDGERRDALESLAARLGIASRVHFLGWTQDLPGLYADLDLLTLSSHNEGLPTTIIEAMAAGVPVVATRVGSVPDLLEDGHAGRLVPPDAPEALATAILEELAVLPQRRQRAIEQAEHVRTRYGADRMAAQVAELYRSLLAARAAISPPPPPPPPGGAVLSLWLVTGGAGFIGSSIVRALLSRGERVRVLDSFATGSCANLAGLRGPLDVVEADVRDMAAVVCAMREVTHVLHQAALPSVARSVVDPLTTHDVNVRGTLNVLLAARDAGVGRLVFASSSSVYGDAPGMPRCEDHSPSPVSPYALSKLTGETYALVFHKIYGLPVVALRYFNVFGPRQDPDGPYAAVIPRFVRALLTGQRPVVFGDGTQTRDFTFVENVVQANVLGCEGDRPVGRAFNVATGRQTSLLEILEILGRLTGVKPDPIFEDRRTGDVLHSRADLSRAVEGLGYQPAISLEEGLERTVAWHRQSMEHAKGAPVNP